jgi:hypothetical protein
MEFNAFPKIARLNREMVITEKIDGTNASIEIVEARLSSELETPIVAYVGEYLVYAGSRTRYITPENDNQGFAKWVRANAEELVQLGSGQHFGEWWGQGIQRTYGLTEKRFSLFNVSRWVKRLSESALIPNSDPRVEEYQKVAPLCCGVVPVLYKGPFNTAIIDARIGDLRDTGSVAAPGFMKPEGIVVYHTAANQMFKVTLEKDEQPKGRR